MPRSHPLVRLIAAVTALAVGLQCLVPMARAQAMNRSEYEACQARDESAFRDAIAAVTVKSLRRSLSTVDFPLVVSAEWRRVGVDKVMDAEIERTMAELRSETGWLAMWGTLFSSEKAQKLASAAAERVYTSDGMKRIVGELADAIGREIGKRMELATSDAAEPAVQCLQAFLGPRYGTTVARVVGSNAGKEFAIAPDKAKASVSTGAVLVEGAEGIAGAVVLLVRRQLSNMSSRIGQRIVGAVLGRIVAVVAGGLGVILIAKDAWDFRHGVLPIVADEMRSSATKEKVRAELAKTSAEQINEHMQEIGTSAADRVIEIWHDFRRAHAKVLELAEKSEAFKRFIEAVQGDRLARLDEVVALIVASEGEAGVLKRLDNGTLQRAIHSLPPEAIDIARDARSLDRAFAWADLAGDQLARVVELELYRRADPGTLSKAALTRILGLGDRLAATRIAALKRPERDALLELSDADLKTLARALDEGQLATLSSYLTGLERNAAQRVLRVVAETPARMQALASDRVRGAILASRDQNAAVGMMLKADDIFHVGDFIDETRLVWERQVSPWLLWERHATFVTALGVLALVLLLALRRMLFGRRPVRVVIATKPGTEA